MGHYVRIIVCYLFFLLLIDGCAKQEEKTAKEDAQPEKSSGIVSVEGAELHYVIEGNGIWGIIIATILSIILIRALTGKDRIY